MTVQNEVHTQKTENFKKKKDSVFLSDCALCGKSMNFFNGKIILKDGYVCNNCWNTKGLNKRINYMTDSRNYSSSQIQDMVNTIENAPIDTSTFQTNTLISDLIQLDDSEKIEISDNTSLADEIEKLQALYEKGILTEEEFIQAKKKTLDL